MTKEFSLDEAVPQPNRPHSVMISSGPGLRSGELEWTFAGGTETIPEHPSSVDSHSYSRGNVMTSLGDERGNFIIVFCLVPFQFCPSLILEPFQPSPWKPDHTHSDVIIMLKVYTNLCHFLCAVILTPANVSLCARQTCHVF